ncbi:afadin- and alpha-actinin-binding protein [Austrofundulus limnaeus]|uniref:Afadin- and alpha-actinin-binding protein n=1 Tax=Austrofundulus limnaeus TaxID=52670 RepID=A0A2I4BNW5_AUSLI|nr:PREDICTED: afadin- and alpha-actinin-binding protein-like [Austrofundulus limnaeus]
MASRFGQQEFLEPGPNLNQSPVSTSWWVNKQEDRDKGDAVMEQLKEMNEHVARLQNMLKSERAKSCRLQLQCHHQEMELRRQEMHSSRLKERLSQLIDRPKGKGPSMEVLNVLPGNKREHLDKPFSEEDRTLHLMLERREAELREAVKLHHSLTTLLHALRLDMEQSVMETMDVERPGDTRLDETETSLGEHVTGGVVQSWRKVQKKLQDLCEGRTAAGTDHDKLMVQLETELKESQHLVRMQQQLLQNSLVSPLPLELSDSYFLEEWERLQTSWAELNHQRTTFEKERQAFTDAAIRLSRERLDFDQQRACFVKQQYLCASPQMERRWSSAFNFSSVEPTDTSDCLPITQSSTESGNTAAECTEGQGQVQSPSTPELYAALNLTCSCRSRDAEQQPQTCDGAVDGVHTPWPSYLNWSF